MHTASPAECVHALDLTELKKTKHSSSGPGMGKHSYWGCGALKTIDNQHGENQNPWEPPVPLVNKGVLLRYWAIYSMLLAHKGFKKISLETGPQDFFAPAEALQNMVFNECGPFPTQTRILTAVIYDQKHYD